MSIRLRYNELAPDGLAALREFEHYLNTQTSLDTVLLELVRLRCSQLNGCDFCLHMHAAELHKHNEPQTRIDAVDSWRTSAAFTPRERAALAWAEAITNIQQTHASNPDYAAVSEFFTGKDLVDLTLVIGSINLWNRVSIAFRPAWDPAEHAAKQSAGNNESRSAVGDDGGKVVED